MRAIVTGAAGFIGSHLVDRLLEEGYTVIGIDNLSAGRLENLDNAIGSPSFRFIRGDLLRPDEWLEAFRDVDIVFHLAANPEVRHSVREPLDHYHQNVTVTMHVLEAARQNNVKLVVFASSSTVYGDPEKIPTPETHPLRPISIYGATKAAAETMCLTYARLYGMKCLVLRYANIVGPRLRHGVIYDFIMKLKENPMMLEILGDGSQRKSYLYVDDAVEATLRAVEHVLEAGKREEVYNVGNTDWVTVREIADIVVETMGLRCVEYVYKPATPDGRGWPGDVKLMLLDIVRIRRDTGWEPRMNSREAVRRTAEALLGELGRAHVGGHHGRPSRVHDRFSS
ncbi:NAD-dependent epimerase/dehydratase family protein [Pyrofollis japonicus]|uniref:NAD-dependent epimerase/dehydratase family protein n=1 Tax=Pyrofollis japonicus TaxID=3060460 RepID=UPI00295BE281|nr:NAD-dependent epimerase/dehydratase family protein [Pyrofollis japonicus]BEP18349.1 NAD-dependent epimerase/dehydratase family protein [Pyrofollis japonicus]